MKCVKQCCWSNSIRVTAVITRAVTAFAPNKHLKLADPNLSVQVEAQGELAEISVSAQSFARFVEVSVAGADIVFSDNYFDIPAGQTVKVTCPLPDWMVIRSASIIMFLSARCMIHFNPDNNGKAWSYISI
jgi:hypothetical protein